MTTPALEPINVCALEDGRVHVFAWLRAAEPYGLAHAQWVRRNGYRCVWIDDSRAPGVTLTAPRTLDWKHPLIGLY